MLTRIPRIVRYASILLVAMILTTGTAWALGFILGQSKEELKLDYDVTVYDHQTGRVTVTLTLKDDGRLKPIESIDFHVPSTEKHADGQGTKSDLSLTLATHQDGNKRTASVHIRKEWAEKSEFWLTTYSMDGKRDVFTRRHFIIPVAKYMKAGEQKKG